MCSCSVRLRSCISDHYRFSRESNALIPIDVFLRATELGWYRFRTLRHLGLCALGGLVCSDALCLWRAFTALCHSVPFGLPTYLGMFFPPVK